jgi:hypothetical protein
MLQEHLASINKKSNQNYVKSAGRVLGGIVIFVRSRCVLLMENGNGMGHSVQ